MSTKISSATPSVPTAPAEPVKPAEAPRAPGKADVEGGVVKDVVGDVVERGASIFNAGAALFGGGAKRMVDKAVDTVEGAAKEVAGGAAKVTRSVADLQADAARAVDTAKSAVIEAARPSSISTGQSVITDLIKKGVEVMVKDEFKSISPQIADPKQVMAQLDKAAARVEEGLKGVAKEARHDAAKLMLDIKNETAPYLTADDLKLPFTEPRRVLAEAVKIGEELGASAVNTLAKGAVDVGLAGAGVIAEHGDGVRDAAESLEYYASGRFLTQGTPLEGLRPFALINLPMVMLLDGVQNTVGAAETITAQADNIRAFTDALTPGTTQADILALKDNETLTIGLGGKGGLGLGAQAGLEGKVELKVTRQPGDVFIAEVTQEQALTAGVKLGVLDAGGALGSSQKITVELKGEQAVKDFVGALYGHGMGVVEDPRALHQIAEKITREESNPKAVSLGGELPMLSGELKRNFAFTKGEVTDKSGQPVSTLYKLSTTIEGSAGKNATGDSLKLRLPQLPGEQGAAVRAAMGEQLKQTPLLGAVIKRLPDAALDRLVELNGARTDMTLKVQHQVDLQLDLPANNKDLGKATQLTLTNTIVCELGDSALECKLEMSVKNPAALFKLFPELSPSQLVARMGEGAVTQEDIETRAASGGFKLSDILTVKLSSTEKTARLAGVEVEAGDLGVKTERGVTKNTLIGEHVFIGADPAAAPDADRAKAPVGRTILDFIGTIKG